MREILKDAASHALKGTLRRHPTIAAAGFLGFLLIYASTFLEDYRSVVANLGFVVLLVSVGMLVLALASEARREPHFVEESRHPGEDSDQTRKDIKMLMSMKREARDKLADLANVVVRDCMRGNDFSDNFRVEDYGLFWVKFYRLGRDSYGRLQLKVVAASRNTPSKEREMVLEYGEGGAGYVLAQLLTDVTEDRFEGFEGYHCDRERVLARLSRRNRERLEPSPFRAEFCYPIGVDKADDVRLFGIVCFCADCDHAIEHLHVRRRVNKMTHAATLAATIVGGGDRVEPLEKRPGSTSGPTVLPGRGASGNVDPGCDELGDSREAGAAGES